MKNILILIILALAFQSCTFDYVKSKDEYLDDYYSNMFKDVPLYYGDFSEIRSIREIPAWMHKHIDYISTQEIKSPQEVLESGSGDCDGFTLIYANIAYVQFGLKYSICLTLNPRKIVEGGRINHAVLRSPLGQVIEPQSGEPYTYPIGYEYSFEHVFIVEPKNEIF